MQGAVNILGRSAILWLWSIISITLGWHLRIAIGTVKKVTVEIYMFVSTKYKSYVTLFNVSVSDY